MAPDTDAVLHLAALHTLAAAGFASTSKAASITLSTVLAKYLRLVADTCVARANLAGRNKVAALDVVDGLEDLGVRVGELVDWAEGSDQVVFEKDALGGLEDYLRSGLSMDNVMGQLQFVPEEDMPEESDDEEDEDSLMEDIQQEPDVKPDIDLLRRSPDFSWLPPLPTEDTCTSPPEHKQEPSSSTPAPQLQPQSIAQSIADRYRHPIPYSFSQLSQTHPFTPPVCPVPELIPPSTTSLPSLLATYSAIASDPSVSLRQNDLRRQAAELLRRSIAPVDAFSPSDTLFTPIPPVKGTPIIPSHSDTLPPKLIPVNPRQDGILASLVQQISSPYLPPQLRDRLTGLRPPVAQVRHGEPVLYGPPTRGPDDVLLSKAKGKVHPTEESTEEIYLRRTWNSGPRGGDKYGRRLQSAGKRVISSKEGEPVPRKPARPVSEAGQPAESEGEAEGEVKVEKKKVMLRLSSSSNVHTAINED